MFEICILIVIALIIVKIKIQDWEDEKNYFLDHTDFHSQEHKTEGENSEKPAVKKWIIRLLMLAAVVVMALPQGKALWEALKNPADYYAIEWNDKALEKAVRNVTRIHFRPIRYND
ncbi:MAG: hypothetical protein ACSW8A_08860 [Lachnospiraceae bacterium]